ncbi:carbamoyltransferase family protein [Saccharopolyspora elongata]|uniref:Carbamoyltransferase n=1 Tax=Saccharopolyspora elongata TaxID=2530387 RepID=A0A4V2YJW0_9PSEU|nr:carbamoyltransferase C-terminal domain-containing protein [Saccharopolyspora elongata]TDD40287.1 carbamoyltransferase [Saccharopolyspora elongata]
MSRSVPSVVLGLCAFTHDSAAALLIDGRLVGFVEEERLSGVKHDRSFPQHAVQWLLREQGLSAADVDEVAYNFVPARYLPAALPAPARLVRDPRRAMARSRSFVKVAARTHARLAELRARFPCAGLRAIPHHRAHGLYAFAASGADDAAVLIVDSLGETETTTIASAHYSDGRLVFRQREALTDPASLGYVYGAVTEHLGWRRGDEEGTVMALAALGDPTRFRQLLADAVRMTSRGFTVDPRLIALRVLSGRTQRLTPEFIARTCPPRHSDEPVTDVHQDLAAALQERTEQIMLHLARRARQATGASTLCVGGGVAMNCVSIGRIADAGIFEAVTVPPAPGDSGTAIGAALASWHHHSGHMATGAGNACYLGPAFGGLTLPTTPRPGARARRLHHRARYLAEQLAAGRIIGVFTGALEAGPRALGHRSILASPLDSSVVDRLNSTVKYREPFRPFAPVILADKASDYVRLGAPSPFMSRAHPVTDLARERIPSIVHANGTARAQTVDAAQNQFLTEVLTEFAALTGTPVLINTSLNVKGKPICGTPEMALDCLADSGIDALLLEDWWVVRQ